MINTNDIRVKQKSYSQNAEDVFVLDYFKGFKGTLLEIGANDGLTLSNSRLLIENGWKAFLVEPGDEQYGSLVDLYGNIPETVRLFGYGISDKNEELTFYQSGSHIQNGDDRGLVSTFDKNQLSRWPNVEFTETVLKLRSWIDYWEKGTGTTLFDFISIDAEGYDWKILSQINLTAIGCKCLCIEFNGNKALEVQFTNYCAIHTLKLAHKNSENLIFIK